MWVEFGQHPSYGIFGHFAYIDRINIKLTDGTFDNDKFAELSINVGSDFVLCHKGQRTKE